MAASPIRRASALRKGCAAVALAMVASAAAAAPPARVDLLIAGGTVYDGGEGPGRALDVGVAGDRIVFVGDAGAAGLKAARVLDAHGLAVAPGFIDPHTHALSDLRARDPDRRRNLNYLAQGVTTVVVGNDGDGPPEVKASLDALEAAGVGPNVAALVGFGPVRGAVVGEAARAPTPEELERMRALVAKGMCEGALGFSTGLYYAPQSFAATDEVIALAREAGARGGLYDSHLRDEGSDNIGLLAAVDEALTIGRAAGTPVHIAHLKALGVDAHGLSDEVIARIEAERAQGRRVTADQYPWTASGTRVSNALMPRWAMDGGMEALKARLADPALQARLRAEIADNLRRRGGPDSLLIVQGDLSGQRLAQVAARWGVDPVEAAVRIVRAGDARVASFNMADDDVRAFMARPWVMTSSDGTVGHPRKYGSFPLKFARFVRDEKLMDVAAFVRRSSGLTADTLGLEQRGYVRDGYFADLVVFDPNRFEAKATYEQPEALAGGVVHLLVNGALAIEAERPTTALSGRGLTRPRRADWDCPA